MAERVSRSNDLGFGQGRGLKILTWAGVLFLLLPLFILIVYSFNDSRTVTHWEGFSLRWYRSVFSDSGMCAAIRNSVIIALFSTLIATALGTLAALLLAKYRFAGKKLFQNLLYVPVILPEIIFGVALLALFILIRFPLGILSVICAHITFSFPFATMVILGKAINLPNSLTEASLDLGAGRWQTFRYIILPNLSPGIVSGALFAFTMSIDDFVITFFTAGVGASTLPLKIYSLIKYGITPSINAVSTLLILFTITALLLSHFLQKSEKISRPLKLSLAGLILLILVVLIVSPVFTRNKNRLNIYNYSGYLDENLINQFSEQTGIKVTLDYYNDNEELLTRMKMGVSGYDIIFPSGYMVGIMKRQNLLAPFDFASMPNYRHIRPDFKKMPFDTSGRYYVPYAYGFTGIVYNSTYIEEPVDSWKVLWDARYKGKILMVDEMREVFHVAYKMLGYPKDTDPKKLNNARDLLIRQKPLLRKYESNAIETMMASEEVWIAQVWNGFIYKLKKQDPKFKLGYPKEGVLFFIDNLCIPANAPNKENARRFIDFLLDPAHSAQNIISIGYAMPNDSARQLIDPQLVNDPSLFPDVPDFSQVETSLDLGEFNRELTRAWTEVKAH